MNRITLFFISLILFSGVCAAQSYRFEMTAGSSDIELDFNARHYRESGYLNTGIGGYISDDNDDSYQLLHATLGVGSESLARGLKCDLGFRGIVAQVEKDDDDGDAGALGFNASAVYLLPEKLLPIPVEIFGNFTWAPEILSFIDMEAYQEMNFGIGIYIVENASFVLSYRNSRFDMDDDWRLKDEVFSIGLAINF